MAVYFWRAVIEYEDGTRKIAKMPMTTNDMKEVEERFILSAKTTLNRNVKVIAIKKD